MTASPRLAFLVDLAMRMNRLPRELGEADMAELSLCAAWLKANRTGKEWARRFGILAATVANAQRRKNPRSPADFFVELRSDQPRKRRPRARMEKELMKALAACE